MNNLTYTKIQVTHTSYEALSEQGWEPSDNGFVSDNSYSNLSAKRYARHLTYRQRQILALLMDGKTRKEIGNILCISEQAVHQIIPRMRKRLNQKAGIPLTGWKRRHGGY